MSEQLVEVFVHELLDRVLDTTEQPRTVLIIHQAVVEHTECL